MEINGRIFLNEKLVLSTLRTNMYKL